MGGQLGLFEPETGVVGIPSPQIAMDASGSAIAVWIQMDITGMDLSRIYANRYVPSIGWEGAQLIGSNEETAAYPQIAMHARGVAIAIWEQGSDIYTNRYVIGSGWEGEQLIGSGMRQSGLDINLPQIAKHINGVNANAIAVWEGKDSPSIYANRYVVGSGWEGAQLIDKSGGHSFYPNIAMDAGGIAIVVWQQDFDIYANRYVPGSGWEGGEAIGGRNGSLPKIAMDADGNAIALWQRWNDSYGGNDLYTNRYVPGSGWEGAELIAPGEWDHQTPRITMDDSGTAIVVWEQDNLAGEGTTIKSYIFNINETTTTTAPYSTTTTTMQNGDGFTLTVIDTITVGENPRGIAVNSETNRIYVANAGSDDVSVIDGSTNEIIATVEVGGGPDSVGVNPTTKKIYVINQNSASLSVIDGSTNEVVSTIQLSEPGDVAVNRETNRIYVGNTGNKGISVIDGFLDEVIETIEVGYRPEKLDVNLKTNRIYALTDSTNVTVIDGDSNDVVTTIEIELNPKAIGVNSETDRIYVTNTISDTVTVIDGSANEIITSVSYHKFIDSKCISRSSGFCKYFL